MNAYIYKKKHAYGSNYTVSMHEIPYANAEELGLEYIDEIDIQDWLERLLSEGDDEQLEMLRELQ